MRSEIFPLLRRPAMPQRPLSCVEKRVQMAVQVCAGALHARRRIQSSVARNPHGQVAKPIVISMSSIPRGCNPHRASFGTYMMPHLSVLNLLLTTVVQRAGFPIRGRGL